MRRSALHAVALALVLLVAGCGGLFGTGGGPDAGSGADATTAATSDPTTDPAEDSPTTGGTRRSTTAPAAGGFPPGIGPDGVDDPIELRDAHVRSLSNASYTVRGSFVVRSAGGGREPGRLVYRTTNRGRMVNESRYNVTLATDGPESRFLGDGSGRVTYYADGDRVLRHVARDGRDAYGVVGGPNGEIGAASPRQVIGYDPTAGTRLYGVLSAVDTTTVETPTGGGSTVALRGSTLSNPDLLARDANLTDPRNASLSATVGRDGRIRELRLAYDATWTGGEYDGEPVRVEWALAYSSYGETTIDRPAWDDRAVRGTTGNGGGDGNGSGSGNGDEGESVTGEPAGARRPPPDPAQNG